MKICLKLSAVVLTLLTAVTVLTQSAGAVSASAKAYVVINAETGEVLVSSNAHLRLSMASTTKIMTALILAEQNTPEKEITATKEMVTVEGSSMGLLPGDKVSYYELLIGMLLPSGNDAANTAAICVAGSTEKFADLMNRRAAEIGMTNTHFVTPSGLDDKEHYTTAYDMSLLAAEALKNETIRDIVSKESITVTFGNPPYQRTLYNHNKLLGLYEYCIGVKTGFTKKSGRCLVSAAEKDGCRVIAVTLNDPNDWNDHCGLLDYGLSKLSLKDVTADIKLDALPVVGGKDDTVSVAVPRYFCGCTDATQSGITAEVSAVPFVYAPVNCGQTVGYVNYCYNGKIIHTSEIIALRSVECVEYKPGFFERFKKQINNLFMFFI